MDQMGVAIDQAGRDPAIFAIDDLGVAPRGRHVGFRPDVNDAAAARHNCAVLDDAQPRQVFGERRKPRIAPDARRCESCVSAHQLFRFRWMRLMYRHIDVRRKMPDSEGR
jgi:hypothetical protein